jgi:hypothetical protein
LFHDVAFLPDYQLLFHEIYGSWAQLLLTASLIPGRCASWSIPAFLLNSPKEEQDEHNYQDRPQDAGRGIAPTSAMGPGREGADENEDEYNNQNSAEHGISPLWLVVSLTQAAA